MVGHGASLHGHFFLGGTDGSDPLPSSSESVRWMPGPASLYRLPKRPSAAPASSGERCVLIAV
jgi:hypothetical protein